MFSDNKLKALFTDKLVKEILKSRQSREIEIDRYDNVLNILVQFYNTVVVFIC